MGNAPAASGRAAKDKGKAKKGDDKAKGSEKKPDASKSGEAKSGEGFFAKLTKRRLKRGTFLSVVDLQAAINRFVVEHNAEPKPFTWTADPNKIIQAVRRGHQVLDSIN